MMKGREEGMCTDVIESFPVRAFEQCHHSAWRRRGAAVIFTFLSAR